MKTSLSRWGLAALDVFFFLLAVLVAVTLSIPGFILVVQELGFWQATFEVLGLFGLLTAPFVVYPWGRDAYRSVRHAIQTGKGADTHNSPDPSDIPTPGTEDRK